jgi:transposase
MQRYALTNRQWKLIVPLLPGNGKRGKQWKDHRLIINGILWILKTGAPWRDLPLEFGPWKTVYERFRLWSRNGLWDKALAILRAKKNREGKIDWRLFCVDGTVIRAHKASAGAGKKWAEGRA